MSDEPIVVVGIGADGWGGLGDTARGAVLAARTIVGSRRQLELLPPTEAERRPWPSPIDSLLEELVAGGLCGACVLASGDPMLHGIGATLARRLQPGRLVVHPHPSAFALACARLGWPAAEVELVSIVGRAPEGIARTLQPGRRVIVYVSGADGAALVARVARDHGLGPSQMVVLEHLGGPRERIVQSTVGAWVDEPADPLHLVALECRGEVGSLVLPRVPGLPDQAYLTDGQLTKRMIRAITLAALGPLPHRLLWDVGAGSGSVAIEWLRAEPTARAIAIEARSDRAQTIRSNSLRLGVPGLEIREGRAPSVLDSLDPPDAIFIGGGLSADGLLDRCWKALGPGGRLVANAVTLEGEQVLHAARRDHGGELVRLASSRAEPVGGFESWRPQMPVVQWSVERKAR